MIANLALGSIIGSILAGVIKLRPANKGKFVVVSVAVQALCIGAFGYSSSPLVAMLVLGLVGLVSGITNVMIISVIQMSTPSEIRGRVFGLLGTMSAGLAPISMGLAGFVADALDRNIPLIYAFCGLGVFLLLPVLILSRPFHAMMAIDVADDESNEEEHLDHPDNIGGENLDPGRA
jgi:MFS family permease